MVLYKGTVVDRERVNVKGKDYVLIKTKSNSRPLAVTGGSIWPPNGSVISANANPGLAWDFATAHEISIDPAEAPAYELEKRIPGVAGLIAPLIMDWLRWHRTCTSDDIHDKALELVPGRDPRVVGTGFVYLARRGLIKKIGFQRSKRSVNHHYPNMAVWELVVK
jgi:hypothetical protein